MITHDIAPPPPHSATKLRCVLATALSVIAALAVLVYVLSGRAGTIFGIPATATPLAAAPSLLRYSAQLTTHALNDKQRLLNAYAYTLGQIDTNDSLATKKWLNSHGDLVSRLFEETRLVFLSSADATAANPLTSWLLRPGQAATLTSLEGSIAAKFSELLTHKLTSSIEISYVVEQGEARVIHASPALNKQGQPVAVLIALTPLTGYLSLDSLNSANHQHQISMPSDEAVLGPFITNDNKQLLASPAGHHNQQLQALLNRLQAESPANELADYFLQWQRIPGTTWHMGLAIAQTPLAQSTPAHWLQAIGLADKHGTLDWTIAGLGPALAAGLLVCLVSVYRRRPAKTSQIPDAQTTPPWTALKLAANPDASSLLPHHPARELSEPLPLRSDAASKPPADAAHKTLHLSMVQLKRSRQCLVLLRHGKILAMSQGALEFLQLDPMQSAPRTIQSLLAQPEDYERLHILIDAAAHDAQPFSFNIEVVDALKFRHVVYAQAYPPGLASQHQRLVFFEAEHARLGRLCPASLVPHNTAQLDPISLLPSFDYWHALLQGLLRLNELQSAPELTTAAPERPPPGYVFYLAIDGFASLGCAGGKAFCDEALRYTANALTHALSQQAYRHVIGHVQKEQFALACLGLNTQQALLLAKQLQQCIAHLQASYQSAPMLLSISIGLAALPERLNALDTQLNAADLACFDAASKGLEGLVLATQTETARH